MIIDKLTGLMYETDTDEQVIESMILVNDQLKSLDYVKKQLRDLIIERDLSGKEHNDRLVRVSSVQRMSYDKSLLRELLDEDTYDVLVKPDKTAVDTYIKENLEQLGEISTQLRKNMIPEGNPYTIVKIERLQSEV